MLRILPRDAFNDANLLKCIGQLTMLIEDGVITNLTYAYDGEPFNIRQNEADGSTYVANIAFYNATGDHIPVTRGLNSRNVWPLVAGVGDAVFYVFYEKGKYMLRSSKFDAENEDY